MLRIGVSACYFHADFKRPIFKGKTLLYLVEDVGHWLLRQKIRPYLIPALPKDSPFTVQEFIQDLDGLVLQGGSDVAPESYGSSPLKPEWAGDARRDQYEIALVQEFMAQGKPILGLCRGLQLLNVALGGTLIQDIPSQCPQALEHRNWEIYDQNFHQVEFVNNSSLQKIYGSGLGGKVNSVHHQAIKELGKGLKVEAYSIPDRVIEAIRWEGNSYVMAVQWHPEFQDDQTLSAQPLLMSFVAAARERKTK